MLSSERKNNYMAFIVLLLKTCFIWPLDTRRLLHIFLYRLVTWFTCIILAAVSIGQLLKMCVSLDLAELSSTVDVFTLTASALYKLVYLLVNMKTLVYIVNVVHYNFEERPIQGLDPFTMSAHIRPTSLLSVIYVLSGQITSVIWCFVPLLFSPVSPVTDPTAPLTLKNRRTMPMNVWLPFNFAYSPAYEIVFVLESFAFFMSALLYLSIDCFYFYLIYVICGQLKLLDASFKTLFTIEENLRRDQEGQKTLKSDKDQLALIKEVEPSWIKDNQKAYRDRILNQHLERIINLHAVVLDLVRLIEVFFSSPIVVDFLHAILSLSFALFQTQMSVTFMEMIKMYIFIVVCILHQFFNNFFGEELIHAQHMIVNSVYESPWYTGDRRFKRSVRMIAVRSLRPIKLSGFKMYILCLQSFVEFCRRIFSYYTVLSEVSKA